MNSKRAMAFDIWAYLYTFLLIILTIVGVKMSAGMFVFLLLAAIPFVVSPERFICVSLLFSSISYYFFGSYDSILSIYTILIIIALINIIFVKKSKFGNRADIISLLILCVLSFISYKNSPFLYQNGFLKLLYIIVVSIVIGNIYRINLKEMTRFLPKIACVFLAGIIIALIVSGTFINSRLTINLEVNPNSFGKLCAMVGVILLSSYQLAKKKKIYLLCAIVAIILVMLSGSRGSLLAVFVASSISMLASAKKKDHKKLLLKIVGVLVVLLGVMTIVINAFEMNSERYSLDYIVDSGGSNRALIYTSVVPYVVNNGYWKLGYGPGHENSREILVKTINKNYAHTHNTFVESFAELGIIGLIMTLVLYTSSFKRIKKVSKEHKEAIIIFSLLIWLIINGMVESFFCYITMWLILALCRNSYIFDDNKTSLIEKECLDEK